jgi:hypothetical protein
MSRLSGCLGVDPRRRVIRESRPFAALGWLVMEVPKAERHLGEVERILFSISDTARKAVNIRKVLATDGAEPHVLAALEEAERNLEAERRRLMHATYYATPDQERLAV